MRPSNLLTKIFFFFSKISDKKLFFINLNRMKLKTPPMCLNEVTTIKFMHFDFFLSLLESGYFRPLCLQYPDFFNSNELHLHTDASRIALGSILCNKDDHPVAIASCILNNAGLNYPTIEKEVLALFWPVKPFRSNIYIKNIKMSPHTSPTGFLFRMHDISSRFTKKTKFRVKLEEHDFKIIYNKGKII